MNARYMVLSKEITQKKGEHYGCGEAMEGSRGRFKQSWLVLAIS